MNLNRLHQRSKMRISKRRIKRRAEEGNHRGSLFKLLLGQPCWSYLDLRPPWTTLASPVLWAAPKTRSSSHGWGHWAASFCLRGHYAAAGSIMTHCKRFLQAFKTLESYRCSAEMDLISPEARQVWHRQARWSKLWISSICHSPSSCVELLLVVRTAYFTRACSKTAKPIFRCRQ